MAVVLLCQCGSDRVDITQWNGTRARLRCFTCEREAWLDGFTVTDLDPVKLVTAAVIDQPRKHRKRSPQELYAFRRARVIEMASTAVEIGRTSLNRLVGDPLAAGLEDERSRGPFDQVLIHAAVLVEGARRIVKSAGVVCS